MTLKDIYLYLFIAAQWPEAYAEVLAWGQTERTSVTTNNSKAKTRFLVHMCLGAIVM